MRSRHYRLRPTHLCDDRTWDEYLDAKADHFNPDDEWERRQKVCPWCGDAPKAWDEDRCVSCLLKQVEKEGEMPRNANVNPVFRELLLAMSPGVGIPPAPTPAPSGEPTVAGDFSDAVEACDRAVATCQRITKENKP